MVVEATGIGSTYNEKTHRFQLQVKQCPITMGNQTRMSAGMFDRLCQLQNREKGLQKGHNKTQFESTIYDDHCKRCGGQHPPELTIIEPEEIEMVTTRKEGICELFLRDEGLLKVVDGKKCCSTCEPIRRNAKKRPELMLGQLREFHLQGILGNLDQTFGGRELYASVEEKAAHLLYFVIKDHPFSDGNKRIGAFLFLLFLKENNLLDQSGINDNGLVALALLIAESAPKQKELLIVFVILH